MINFNKGTEKLNKYLGSERKTTILYNDELYMIKFPDPIRKKNNPLSYMNNQYSEHIGCRIFEACGFKAQETKLGVYTDKRGRKKIVVGCKDFTTNGSELHEFSKLINSLHEIDNKLKLDISTVNMVIEKCDLIKNKTEILNSFWDMFVIDTLIGNTDRHFDNWGVLECNEKITFAPIYDCGSSLGALLDDKKMSELLKNSTEFKNEEYNIRSCYNFNGKRIFYHEIYKKPPKPLSEAVKRIYPRIDMTKTTDIIKSVDTMSPIRKNYLIKSIEMRYEHIITPTYKKILKEKNSLRGQLAVLNKTAHSQNEQNEQKEQNTQNKQKPKNHER